MKTFQIEIKEVLTRTIEVEAATSEEAVNQAEKMYYSQDIVLDYDDLTDHSITDLEEQAQEQVREAKLLLESSGFQAENLWNVHDVKERFECDYDQAMKVLKMALTDEYVMSTIFEALHIAAETIGLTPKD